MDSKLKYRAANVLFVILLSGCQTIQFENPRISSEANWLTDGKNHERSRSYEQPINPPLELVWEYSANAGFGPGSPLILADQVLVATRKGEVHSIELETGRGRGFKNMGDVIEGTPVISDGIMFVPTAWGKRVLIAFDLQKGVIKWRVGGIPFDTALISFQDLVVGADVEGNVRAYQKTDGREAWSMSLGERQSVKASPLLLDEHKMFIATDTGLVHLLDLNTSEILWSEDVGAPVYNSPSAISGSIYLGTTRGDVVKLSATNGEIQWSVRPNDAQVRIGQIAVDEKTVFFGATDGKVRAVNSTSGSLVWEIQLPDVVSGAPLVTEGHVFIGTMGEELYSVSAETGEIEWTVETKGRIKSAMAVAKEGLIVLSEPKWVSYYKRVENEN